MIAITEQMHPDKRLQPGVGVRVKPSTLFLALLFLPGFSVPAVGSEFSCTRGELAIVNVGEGVTMRTCAWEKSPGNMVRVGPVELIKNGVLILQAQTDSDGKLHGNFIAWDDEGKVIEKGNYSRGLKVGEWLVVDENGESTTLVYREGVPVEP